MRRHATPQGFCITMGCIMTEKSIIKKEDAICLLEDDERVFLIEQDGSYMTAERMEELGVKMILTAKTYGNAIENYNARKEA